MIKPTRNNIIIDIHEKENKSGLVFIDQDKMEKATVISVGSQVTLVQKDDIIYFKNYALDTIKDEDKEYYLISEEDVKGIYYDPLP